MKLSNIKSPFSIQQLFSFISEKKQFKIIKYNNFVFKKLDINYKLLFLQKKIEKYGYIYIKNFWIQFQNDFCNIIENDSYNLFLNILSKNENFILSLDDKDFNSMFNNFYFKENARIELKNMKNYILPKILLIKNGKLTNKMIQTLKEIFKQFSSIEKMSKEQLIRYMNKIKTGNINYRINTLLSYDKDKDGYISFEDFKNYYCNLTKYDLYMVWKDLNNLGYNNFLEKSEEYNLNYLKNNVDKFKELNIVLYNFLQIVNLEINKLCLFYQIDKIFIDYLNDNLIFKKLQQIEISLSNLIYFINSNIICPNVNELNLYVLKIDYDNNEYYKKDIIHIFPNISTLKFNLYKSFDIIDLIRALYNTKIEKIEIYFKLSIKAFSKYNKEIIILKNIKYLLIEGDYDTIFNNIQFPNLENYQLNIDLYKFRNNKNINKIEEIDEYNSINIFLLKIKDKNNKFLLNDLINFLKQLKKIKYLNINLGIISFICDKRKSENYYFEFIINDENAFRKYYQNYDLSIDEKDISKYKKIKIEGLNKLNIMKNNIIEIFEDKNTNLSTINLNINKNKYYVNCLKDIKSIYCEEEIQNTNLISILKDLKLENLKFINLTIGFINESSNEKNLPKNHIYNVLSKLIKYSKNLKSLKLRIHPKNFIQDITFYLSLIENLKKLRILNIIPSEEFEYYLNEDLILKQFPKLKKYYFDEFKIKENNIECIYKFNSGYPTKLLHNVFQDYRDTSLYIEGKEIMKKLFEIYINEKKIDFLFELSGIGKGKKKIKILNKRPLTNMNDMFYYCFSLTSLNLSNLNVNNVINMSCLFHECSNLTSLNLSNFKTNHVTNMSGMFDGCSSLTSLDLSSFNTNNVINMSYMFNYCSSLTSLNLSNFNTNNVIKMNDMFYKCSSLNYLNLSNFTITNVINMNNMFDGIKHNCNIIILDKYFLQQLTFQN